MIFVGVMDPNPIGSKASLAEIFLDKLHHGITKMEEGKYYIEKRALISVDCCGAAKMSLLMYILKEETLVVV